jgi:hypothetical protein
MKRTLLFIVAMGLATAVSAQQFKWVDKDGRLQYGDVPPPGVKAQRLRPPPAGSSPSPSSAAKKGEKALSPEQAFQKRQKDAKEQEEKAAKDRADADIRRANCEAAQASLRQIQGGERITTVNSAGERVFVDDAGRAREAERAQRAVTENCK